MTSIQDILFFISNSNKDELERIKSACVTALWNLDLKSNSSKAKWRFDLDRFPGKFGIKDIVTTKDSTIFTWEQLKDSVIEFKTEIYYNLDSTFKCFILTYNNIEFKAVKYVDTSVMVENRFVILKLMHDMEIKEFYDLNVFSDFLNTLLWVMKSQPYKWTL